ncbi:MAG: tetratricopeptide repeat protein, partial [Planctomycetes bacterium]|nr:tetratricopeptide repeat protein [Planctomycetota bacterium]
TRCSFETRVFVNGREVGRHMTFAPYAVDVTDFLQATGENEILIAVRDTLTAAAEPDVIKGADPTFPAPPTRWRYPTPWNWGILGDVAIVARPAVYVENAFVKTSVRQQTLELEVTVRNDLNVAQTVSVSPAVFDAGRGVLGCNITAQRLTIQAGDSGTLKFQRVWRNPVLWEPGSPHLYELRVALSGAGGDVWRDRFGFRESWQEGHLYYFNGKVAKYWRIGSPSYLLDQPRGDASWGRYYESVCADYENFPGNYLVRLRDLDPRVLVLCDEAGMPVHGNIGYHAGGAAMWSSDVLWQNITELALGITWNVRNHPSLVMYETFNEINWGFTSAFSDGVNPPNYSDDPENLAGHRVLSVLQAVRNLDPTRPITSDANGDLGGLWDTIDLHYAEGGGGADLFSRGLGESSKPNYVPDSAFYKPIDGKAFEKGQKIRIVGTDRRFGEKPISHGEIGEYGLLMPVDGTLMASDRAYRDWYYANGRIVGELDRVVMDGARDLESSMMNPWENTGMQGTYQLAYPPVVVNLLNTESHYRSGEEIVKHVNIHHDVWDDEKLLLRWRLADAKNKQYASSSEMLRLAPSSLVRKTLVLQAPQTDCRLDLQLVLELVKGTKTIYAQSHPIVVFPATDRPLQLGPGTVLYDPHNTTAPVLDRLGAKVVTTPFIDRKLLAKTRVLLIGRDDVDEEFVRANRLIMEFVEKGGRVVAFEQTKDLNWLVIPVKIDPTRRQSIHFPRVADHPVLRDVTESDLRYWRPDRCTAKAEYRKPSLGSALPIVDSGGRRGLEYTSLMEVYHGQGSYLLCQLAVIERAEVEPMAAKLLQNIIEYTQAPLYRQLRKVAIVGQAKGSLALCASRLRFQTDLIDESNASQLGSYSTILADGRSEVSLAVASAVAKAVRAGATLVLHDMAPESCDVWAKATNLNMSLRKPLGVRSRGHVVLDGSHELLAGVCGGDLFWQISTTEDASAFFEKCALDKLVEYECVGPDNADVLSFPDVLISIPCGKGTVLVDQLRWDKVGDNEKVSHLADRLASLILTNAGAGFRPMPASRDLPPRLNFQTVDIQRYTNRALVDKVAGDGKGGWSDEGPDADLREFRPGQISRLGAPFDVKSSCIVLGRRGREAANIVINKPVEAFYFIHTASSLSAGQNAGRYVVNYADGSFASIDLVGDRNIRDWTRAWPQEDFTNPEPGELAQLAWTGSCRRYPVTSLYAMRWINPYPDQPVKSLSLSPPAGDAETILLAVTLAQAAQPAEKAAVAPSARDKRDRALARILADEGMALQRKGTPKAAQQKYEQAIRADDTYAGAYGLLGVLHVETRQYRQAEDAFGKQTALDPKDTTGWNNLGQLLLMQQRWDEALTAFEQSLKANWNQPEIIQNVRMLQDKKAAGQSRR